MDRTAPTFVEPMAALNTAKLPEGSQWIYELKFDGYRALALKHGKSVRLVSRRGNELTRDYPDVAEAVQEIDAETALLDGEVVALDDQGRPSFQMLHIVPRSGRTGTCAVLIQSRRLVSPQPRSRNDA